MARLWPDILAALCSNASPSADGDFAAAQAGVLQVANHIAGNARYASLFGWTSMHDLCVQQIDSDPHDAWPYLRIRPLPSGLIEFRYFDTAVSDRQWHREVMPQEAVDRLELFFRQLCWF